MTTITALPTPPNRSMAQSVFTTTADAFLASLPTFVTQTNLVASEVNTNATNAATSAANALASMNTASTYATAATNAANVFGTSTTTVTPVVTVSQSIAYATGGSSAVVGMRVRFASRANPATNWGSGTITANAAGTLTVNVDNVGNAPASASDWNIMLEGTPGVGATLETAKVTITTSGTLVRGNAGAQVVSTNASAITLDKSANLGNGWSVFLPQIIGGSYPCTFAMSNGESISGGGLTQTTPKTVPASVPAIVQNDGTQATLTRFVPITDAEVFGTPSVASVLAATSNAGGGMAVCALTTTRGFVAYRSGASVTTIALVDNTGASLGTAQLVAEACTQIQMTKIDATRALVAFYGTTALVPKIVVVSFSGTAVTVGTSLTINASAGGGMGITILPGTSKAVAAVNQSTTDIKATVFTIGSGTTLTSTNSTVYSVAAGVSNVTGAKIVGLSATVSAVFPTNSSGGAIGYYYLTEASGVLTVSASQPNIVNSQGAVDVLSPSTGRVVVVAGSTNTTVGSVYDFTTTSVPMTMGTVDSLPYASSSASQYGQKLVQVTSDSFLCVQATGSPAAATSALVASSLSVLGNNINLGHGSVNLATNTSVAGANNQYGADLFGNTLVVAYTDTGNSNFSTIRAVTIG